MINAMKIRFGCEILTVLKIHNTEGANTINLNKISS